MKVGVILSVLGEVLKGVAPWIVPGRLDFGFVVGKIEVHFTLHLQKVNKTKCRAFRIFSIFCQSSRP